MRLGTLKGATGGIGNETTRLLAAKGYHVFAGVHRPTQVQVFRDKPERVFTIPLDVTDQVGGWRT
jgi:NADP-dependent 3-hydroxy acid dehydrogenase YdfG